MNMMVRAVILARASDPKQIIKGDTLEDQIFLCKKYIDSKKWTLVEIFPCVESGRKSEKEYFWKIFDYCKERKDTLKKIDYLVVKNLSRFTRGGGAEYLSLKKQLADVGVKIQDTLGTVGDEVNTLADLGFEYDWSKQSPTEANEVSQAEGNLQYVRNQLTQMISGCIRYIQKGYWNGPAPYGLMNEKTETQEDGIRNTLVEKASESYFIKRIYEMRAAGVPDKEIVEKINLMGFKTRLMVKRDRKTKVKIGTRGGVKITVKKIQEWIVNPIYCGIIVAKWTKYQPVKVAMFDGLVDIETFNAANKGKIYITKNNDNSFNIKHNVRWANINQPDKRMRDNPLYPYKPVLLCPVCRKEVKASASTGRSGEKFPSYFCDRGHARWHKKPSDVDEVLSKSLKILKFSGSYTKLFEASFIDSWKEKMHTAMKDSEEAESYVSELLVKRKSKLEAIEMATSPIVKKAFEEQFEEIDNQIKKARGQRNVVEDKEVDVKLALRYGVYLMEHPGELLLGKENNNNRRYLFSLVFEELPTYDELVNGTAKLRPIFQLKGNENESKLQLVQRVGVEPTLNGFTDRCLTARLPLDRIILPYLAKVGKLYQKDRDYSIPQRMLMLALIPISPEGS